MSAALSLGVKLAHSLSGKKKKESQYTKGAAIMCLRVLRELCPSWKKKIERRHTSSSIPEVLCHRYHSDLVLLTSYSTPLLCQHVTNEMMLHLNHFFLYRKEYSNNGSAQSLLHWFFEIR